MFEKNGVELPGLTRFMMNTSDFLIGNWLVLSIGLFALVTLATIFGRTYPGQVAYGYVSLRLPIFGFINRQLNIILFINSLVLLLDA